MKKRLISFLLALMLISLPILSFASERTTLQFVTGEDITLEQGIADLLDSLSFSFLRDEGAFQTAIFLNENQIIDLAFKADEEGIYLSSSLLNNTPYCASWDFIQSKISEISAMMGMNPNLPDAESIVKFVKSLLTGNFDLSILFPAVESSLSDESGNLPMDLEKDLPELMVALSAIFSRAVTEEGEYFPQDLDPASSKTSIILTGKDLDSLLSTQAVRSILLQLQNLLVSETSEEENEQAMDELLKQAEEMLNQSEYSLQITAYLQENHWIGADLILFDKNGTPEANGRVTLTAGIRTLDGGTSWLLNIHSELENYAAEIHAALNQMEDHSLLFKLSVCFNDQKFALSYARSETDKGIYRKVNCYVGDNADTFENEIFGLRINTLHSTDSMDYILNKDGARDLSAFTEEDYLSLLSSLAGKSTNLMINIMKNLPSSSLQLITMLSGMQ